MFRRTMIALVLCFALGCALVPTTAAALSAGVAPVILARAGGVPDRYIVVLKRGRTVESLLRHQDLATEQVYTSATLTGFAARLNAVQLETLRQQPSVAYIEQDQVVPLAATAAVAQTQTGAPWGLDRIDQRALPLSGTYTYTQTAANVTVYILDTGIQTAHPDFGGRAAVAKDLLGGNGQDCNGHGTSVAGVIGGAKYGVAKGVKLRSVRVLDCSGNGSLQGVIAGMQYVADHHDPLSVVNMSIGGGQSQVVNDALLSLTNAGIFTVVSAGNSHADACMSSPAGAPSAFTVGATDRTDTRGSFSNIGKCVDAFALGVDIMSDWLSGGIQTTSGTDSAAAHVAGIAALYKGGHGTATNAAISAWLIANAPRASRTPARGFRIASCVWRDCSPRKPYLHRIAFRAATS